MTDMTGETPAMAAVSIEDARPALPEGEYGIVEQLGHRTLIGRVAEVERFGIKMLSIEPLFAGQLLPPVLIGGGSIYAFTSCSAEVADRRQPRRDYQLPDSLRATLPVPALPAPEADEPEPVFAPDFLADDTPDEVPFR